MSGMPLNSNRWTLASVLLGALLLAGRPAHDLAAAAAGGAVHHARSFFRAGAAAAADATLAPKLLAQGVSPVPADLDRNQLAAWTTTANILLNLDETLNR